MSLSRLTTRAFALVAGAAFVAACGTVAPTAGVSQPEPAKTFQTQWYGGACNQNTYALPTYGNVYGSVPGLLGLNTYVYGSPFVSYGYGGFSSPWLFGNAAYGGGYFGRFGRVERQPATTPPGVAEENDVAYRPIGSDIWKRK